MYSSACYKGFTHMAGIHAPLTRLEARVLGHVQGVGYRFFARREAMALGLRGYVRNAADGSVQVTAEGDHATLERYIDVLRRGPSAAVVEDVEAHWGAADGSFPSFRIRY